jgi:sporulation protein YlmC with PRC-barrel domain
MEFQRDEQTPMEQTGQLARLSELDYEMEEGQPDVIGWNVVDENGEEVAKVSDLLVDLDSGAIMLAALSLADKETLVPIESFALDATKSRLVLPANKTELQNAPAFTNETEDVSQFFDYWGADMEDEYEGDENTLG